MGPRRNERRQFYHDERTTDNRPQREFEGHPILKMPQQGVDLLNWALRTLKNKEIRNIVNKTEAYYPEYDYPELNLITEGVENSCDLSSHTRM